MLGREEEWLPFGVAKIDAILPDGGLAHEALLAFLQAGIGQC